ncbi:hypothetical protein E8E11_009064 [Didymella keratinophila]|nr:hypothetical protein E8E11_009064 [Didymella keratinophila]
MAGVHLTACGNNTFALDRGLCESSQLYFVDPDTGKVGDPISTSNTASPSTWSINSLAILASQSAASATPLASLPLISVGATATPTNTPAVSSATGTVATVTVTPSAASAESPASTGISAGAGAGIGIGAAVAVADIAVLAWLLLRERRRRQALEKSAEHKSPIYEDEVGAKVTYAHSSVYESDSGRPAPELETRSRNELP